MAPVKILNRILLFISLLLSPFVLFPSTTLVTTTSNSRGGFPTVWHTGDYYPTTQRRIVELSDGTLVAVAGNAFYVSYDNGNSFTASTPLTAGGISLARDSSNNLFFSYNSPGGTSTIFKKYTYNASTGAIAASGTPITIAAFASPLSAVTPYNDYLYLANANTGQPNDNYLYSADAGNSFSSLLPIPQSGGSSVPTLSAGYDSIFTTTTTNYGYSPVYVSKFRSNGTYVSGENFALASGDTQNYNVAYNHILYSGRTVCTDDSALHFIGKYKGNVVYAKRSATGFWDGNWTQLSTTGDIVSWPNLTTDGANLWAFWGHMNSLNGDYSIVYKKWTAATQTWDASETVFRNSPVPVAFDRVFCYSSMNNNYTDMTVQASTASISDIMNTNGCALTNKGDRIFLGKSTPFSAIFPTGAGGTSGDYSNAFPLSYNINPSYNIALLKYFYWSSSSGNWQRFMPTLPDTGAAAALFNSSLWAGWYIGGLSLWGNGNSPADWVPNTVNSVSNYWIMLQVGWRATSIADAGAGFASPYSLNGKTLIINSESKSPATVTFTSAATDCLSAMNQINAQIGTTGVTCFGTTAAASITNPACRLVLQSSGPEYTLGSGPTTISSLTIGNGTANGTLGFYTGTYFESGNYNYGATGGCQLDSIYMYRNNPASFSLPSRVNTVLPVMWSEANYNSGSPGNPPSSLMSIYLDKIFLKPLVTSLTTVSGLNTSITTTTIKGAGFFGGGAVSAVSSISMQGPLTYSMAGNYTVNAATSIQLRVPSGLKAGAYQVSVTAGGVTADTSANSSFQVTSQMPAVTNVYPSRIATNGTVTLSITGNMFFGGMASTSDVASVNLNGGASSYPASPYSVISDSVITGALLPAGLPAGTYDVRVANTTGSNSTSTKKITVLAGPAVTGVTPSAGTSLSAATLTLYGTGFSLYGGVQSCYLINGIWTPLTGFSVASDTEIDGAVLPAGMLPGTYGLRVQLGISGSDQIWNDASAAQYGIPGSGVTVTGITPATGNNTGLTTVTVTGSNFFRGTGSKVPLTLVKLDDAYNTSFNLSGASFSDTMIGPAVVPAGIRTGSYNVKVYTNSDSNTTSAQKFSVTTAVPTVLACSPATRGNTGYATISVTGAGFYGGADAPDVRSFLLRSTSVTTTVYTASSLTVNSDTTLTAVLPALYDGGLGINNYYNMIAVNGGGSNATSVGLYNSVFGVNISAMTPGPGPSPSGAYNNSSVTGSTIVINDISGTGFYGGTLSSTVTSVMLDDAAGTSALSYTAESNLDIFAVVFPGNTKAGTYNVKITTNLGTNLTSPKLIISTTAPYIASFYPAQVYNNGTSVITILGSGFYGGTRSGDIRTLVIDTSPQTSVLSYSVISDSSISFSVPVMPYTGTYNLILTTGNPSAAVTSSPVSIVTSPLILGTITPNHGRATSALTMTVSGGGFYGGTSSPVVTGVKLNTGASLSYNVTADTSMVVILPSGQALAQYSMVVSSTVFTDATSSAIYVMLDSTSPTTQTIIGSKFRLLVPSGCFSQDTLILGAAPADSLVAGANSAVYTNLRFPSYLDPFTIDFNIMLGLTIQPGKTVRVQIDYSSAGLNDSTLENNLKLLVLDTGRWVIVDTAVVDTVNKIIYADVTHFSTYRLGRFVTASSDLKSVAVFPNPADPQTAFGQTVKFMNLTTGVTLRIYTVSGELARTIKDDTGLIEWDMKNDGGSAVVRGIYFYMITNTAGEKVTGRLVLK